MYNTRKVDSHRFVAPRPTYLRYKPCPHALDTMWALIVPSNSPLGFRNKHLLARLDGYNLKLWFEWGHAKLLTALNVLADTRYRATGSNAGTKDVHEPVRISPDLWACRLSVDLRVGLVLKLLKHETIAI